MSTLTSPGKSAPSPLPDLIGGNVLELIGLIQRGLPFMAFEALQKSLGLSAMLLAEYIDLPSSSLARNKKSGYLSPIHSERLVRLARLNHLAVRLFEGDQAGALQWLNTPRATLGQLSPLQLAATELGSREVENLIHRLENGVFS